MWTDTGREGERGAETVEENQRVCDAEWYRAAYEKMVRIRDFETKAAECFTRSELAGNIH